ncbi:MAG: YezD family protein [Lysobacteraceae bacterium]
MKQSDPKPASRAGLPRTIADVPPVGAPLNEHERAVIAALREIAFGEVEVVVHNARIVQITRSQKFRFGER